MSDVAQDLRFVAFARRGLAAAIPRGTASGGAVLSVAAKVRTSHGEREADPVTLRFYGPGNVVGIDTRQVIHTDPRPNTTEFEPNYLAACAFDDPFFPWLFSPEQSHDRMRPWLALVVVDRDSSQLVVDPRRPLPYLTLPAADAADQLHDLSQAWAWAHAQVTGTSATPEGALVGPPELTLSRLLSPRRLRARTSYRACLVPAYLAGVEAGLGVEVKSTTEPAWPAPSVLETRTTPVELPVYYSWEFTTSVLGDFESLARRLRPKPLPADIGGRPMDISHVGLPVPPDGQPGRELSLEGVLGSPLMELSEWPPQARQEFQSALETVLETPPGVTPTVLAPPIYASHQAGTGSELPPEGGDHPWLRRLNLDPRFRVAAGFGTLVVQQLQEQLMASAWDQAGELERGNALLRQAQVARATTAAASAKHLVPLPPDTVLRISAPAHGRVHVGRDGTLPPGPPPPDAPRPETLLGAIQHPMSAFPRAAVAPPFRKVVRPAGRIGRSLPDQSRTHELSQELAKGTVRVPIHPAHGSAGFQEVANALDLPKDRRPTVEQAAVTVPNVTHGFTRVSGRDVDGRSFYHDRNAPPDPSPPSEGDVAARVVGTAAPILPDGDGFGDPVEDSPLRNIRVRRMNSSFKEAAKNLLNKLPVPPVPPPRLTLELGAVRNGLVEPGGALDAERTVAREVLSLLPPSMEPAAGGRSDDTSDPLRPRAAAPVFPHPMSSPLKALDPEMLLPGVERVEPESVGVAVANPRVVESYMAGLNHELSRELLWRGFPTDLGATFFRHFWDSRGSGLASAATADIPPIDEWETGKDLGDNATRVGGPGMLVLIIRGELLRRYPATAIYAVKAEPLRVDGKEVRDQDGKLVPVLGARQLHPEFRGTLDPDLTYLGFGLGIAEAHGQDSDLGWFFVLQEQPTAPRFGLDEAPGDVAPADDDLPTSWDALHWGHPFAAGTDLRGVTHVPAVGRLSGTPRPVLGLTGPTATWGADGAQMAAITYQRPLRVALWARTMLPEAPDPSVQVIAVGRGAAGITALEGEGLRLDAGQAADALRRGALALHVVGDNGERIKLVAGDGDVVTTEQGLSAAVLAGLPEMES